MGEIVYRMHIKPASKKKESPFEFCKNEKIIGIGWQLNEENVKELKKENIFKKYKELVVNQYNCKAIKRTVNCFEEILKNEDSLVWTRDKNNEYYICRISSRNWEYNDDERHKSNDIVSFFREVEYVYVGTVEEVPGKIVNSFIPKATIQRVHDENILKITQMIYNKKNGKNLYKIDNTEKNKNILNLLLPEDVEEIVSLYLQKEKEYLIYTSTNKIDTKKYEFVMVSKDGFEKCYTQVKTGSVPLNPDEFEELLKKDENIEIKKKVYLFAVSEKYEGKSGKFENIICLKNEEILKFIKENKNILPERVKIWLDFCNL